MSEKDQHTEDVLRKMKQNPNITTEQSDALHTAIIKLHMSKTILQMNHDPKDKLGDRTNWYRALMLLKERVPNKTIVDLYYLGEETHRLIRDLNHMEDDDLNKWVAVWNEKI